MEGKPPDEQEREEPTPGGWLPPVAPGQGPDPGVFAPPPYQPPAQQPPPASQQQPPPPAPGQFQPPPPAPGYGTPPPPPGWAPPPWQQQGGWQQPGWQPAPQGPGNGTAITGFVLSISSIALLFFSAGLSSVISLGLAIAGAIVGRNGRQKVDRGETTQHRGLGQAGFIVGIVGAVLSVLAIVAWTLIFSLSDGFLEEDDDFFDEDFQTTRAAAVVLAAALRLTL